MIMQFELINFLGFLLGWISCGIIAILLLFLYITLLEKDKVGFNISNIFTILSIGPIALVYILSDYLKKIINYIFGERIWILQNIIGVPKFSYKEFCKSRPDLHSFGYNYNKNLVNIMTTKNEIIYESTFFKEHINYFKLTYKKLRRRV